MTAVLFSRSLTTSGISARWLGRAGVVGGTKGMLGSRLCWHWAWIIQKDLTFSSTIRGNTKHKKWSMGCCGYSDWKIYLLGIWVNQKGIFCMNIKFVWLCLQFLSLEPVLGLFWVLPLKRLYEMADSFASLCFSYAIRECIFMHIFHQYNFIIQSTISAEGAVRL